jgi:putative transposase
MGKILIKPTKTQIARTLGVSRQSLYYKPKRESIDQEIKSQIESVQAQHPSYGHKRIALELKFNKKRIRRVMKKYDMKPYRRRIKKMIKKEDIGKPAPEIKNLIWNICPIRPGVIWASDFTYIKYKEKYIYLATIMDMYTREIVGVAISRFHNRLLVQEALQDALSKDIKSQIIHSDQGSEYNSKEYLNFLIKENIIPSMSHKGSPWENGYQESYFSNFKLDLGSTDRFNDLAELIEGIYLTVYYYNNKRIHTSLKMTPVQFKQKYLERYNSYLLSKELGT